MERGTTARTEKQVDSLDFYLQNARQLVYEDISEAFHYLEKAEKLAGSAGKSLLADVYHDYAVAYYIKGEYGLSLDYFLDAMEIYRSENDSMGIAKCLIGNGLILQGIDRHEEAINYFKQAIEKYRESGNFANSSPSYLNISISQIETGSFDLALQNLQKAIELSRESGRVGIEHLALNKQGEINFLRQNYKEAIIFHQKVLNHEETPNGWEKSYARAGLAQALLKINELKAAEENAVKALEYSEKNESLWDLERNTKILSEVFAAKGEMGNAYELLQKNRLYKDSLYNRNKLREINFLQLKSKEADNQRLQAENEIAKQKLYINRGLTVFLILILLILIALIVFMRRTSRQKERFMQELARKNKTITSQNELISRQNEKLTELDKSKNRLFSILSHDLRSPIGSLEQILELIKSGSLTEEEKARLLDEMYIQLSGTSTMLHNLLHWAGSQMENSQVIREKIELSEKVEKVMEAHYLTARNKEIKIRHEIPEQLPQIEADRGQLAVILHNLISNAIKFTRKGEQVRVYYEENNEGLKLRIFDGGEGITEDKIKEIKDISTRMFSEKGTNMEVGTGLGLLLVKEFLKANNASLDIKSYPGKGSEFIITFSKLAA